MPSARGMSKRTRNLQSNLQILSLDTTYLSIIIKFINLKLTINALQKHKPKNEL